MTPEERKEIAAYSQEIAKILYKNTEIEKLTSLGKIEVAVRDAIQEYVMPDVGIFLSKTSQKKQEDIKDISKV